ncbi:hypothetical protein B0H11DRAFT_37585 [Mycena galericulata]|nr:hypothetical protein B0H11DRAFT_37585 [Mycena galericulata]
MGTPAAPDWDTLIPIDPVLQQSQSPSQPSQSQSQSQSPATPYSPYTAYTQQHYQQQHAYQAYQQAQQQQQQQTSAASTQNDAGTSAGGEVQAEEEKARTTTTSARPKLDRSRNQPLNPNFDLAVITPRFAAIAAHHGLAGGIPQHVASYIALALRTRLENLVAQMATAARHRTDTQFDRPALYAPGAPMWALAVRSDVAKQVAALERAEREDETRVRRERKERADMTAAHAAALAAQTGGLGGVGGAGAGGGGGMDFDGDDEGGKRKKKKDGPGVTARNMSEDVRKKMSNAVATQAAGLGGKYSWMTASNAAAAAAKPVKAASTTPSTSSGATTTTSGSGAGWARAYVPKKTGAAATPAPPPVEEDTRTAITIRDAQFVVEKERAHGSGRGSGKGWT